MKYVEKNKPAHHWNTCPAITGKLSKLAGRDDKLYTRAAVATNPTRNIPGLPSYWENSLGGESI